MHESTIENHIIDTLSAKLTDVTIDRFYGAVNELDLVKFIHSKVSAGIQGIFVRCEEVRTEPRDTIGLIYNVTYFAEVVCSANIIKSRQLNQIRDTYALSSNVVRYIVPNPVEIAGVNRTIYWDGTRYMFRGEQNNEIVVVRFRVDTSIEIVEP